MGHFHFVGMSIPAASALAHVCRFGTDARCTIWAIANDQTAKRAALVLFAGVVIMAVATEHDVVRDNFANVAAATLLLNVAAMTISFTVSRAARLDFRQSTAVALELGIHNNALAIAIATPIDPALAVPAAVYASFMFFTGGAFARVMSRRNAPAQAARG